ncbi:MAG: hypothetical protein IPM73_09555 [Betaproteobacteria bacterium]|nr:hypothetical protein [Betaproteobacteria bacterium]
MNDTAILARQTDLLYRNTALGQLLTLFNATLLTMLWKDAVGAGPAFVWWGLALLVAGGRIVLARRYLEHADAAALNPEPWLRLAVIGAGTAGLLWGAGALLFMLGGDHGRLFFTAFVMAGMTAGAVPFLGAHRTAFRVYAWPVVVATLCAGAGTDLLHAAFTLMSAAFLFGVTRSADRFHDTLRETLRLEHEKDRLLADLTAARIRAEASAQAKARFLASISHELRTPMNGIMGMADLLAGEGLTPGQRELLTPLRESAQELLGKIENMIELSDLEVGQITLHPTPFSLAELLPAILGDLGRAAQTKGLDFAMVQDEDLPEVVVGDLDKLRKVLRHLVHNAVKFTEIGTVRVTVSRGSFDEHSLRLSFVVQDSGPGIPAAEIPHLFEVFTHGHESAGHPSRGVGVGLPIAHRLSEAMGGSMKLASEVGTGTTVRLELPLGLPQ